MKTLFNRKGEEMVEAAIVLPILILIILSLVLVTLFFYRSLEAQMDLHRDLNRRSLESSKLFGVEKGEAAASVEIRGAFTDTLSYGSSGMCYVINMAPLLRMGKQIDGLQE